MICENRKYGKNDLKNVISLAEKYEKVLLGYFCKAGSVYTLLTATFATSPPSYGSVTPSLPPGLN
jgi:hypothetical protein